MTRAGAARKVTAFVAEKSPDIFAVCEIQPGDALALATRFALSWAYRGAQAVFWNSRFEAKEIVDGYLPAPGALARRRGFLRIRGQLDGSAAAVATTQFHSARARRVPELRFVRSQLRECPGSAVLFAQMPAGRIGVSDLGFSSVASGERAWIWVRDLVFDDVRALVLRV